MARFEAAIGILNNHVGLCVARVRLEETKPDPDSALITAINERKKVYIALCESLQAMDFDNISQTLAEAREVRAELQNG